MLSPRTRQVIDLIAQDTGTSANLWAEKKERHLSPDTIYIGNLLLEYYERHKKESSNLHQASHCAANIDASGSATQTISSQSHPREDPQRVEGDPEKSDFIPSQTTHNSNVYARETNEHSFDSETGLQESINENLTEHKEPLQTMTQTLLGLDSKIDSDDNIDAKISDFKISFREIFGRGYKSSYVVRFLTKLTSVQLIMIVISICISMVGGLNACHISFLLKECIFLIPYAVCAIAISYLPQDRSASVYSYGYDRLNALCIVIVFMWSVLELLSVIAEGLEILIHDNHSNINHLGEPKDSLIVFDVQTGVSCLINVLAAISLIKQKKRSRSLHYAQLIKDSTNLSSISTGRNPVKFNILRRSSNVHTTTENDHHQGMSEMVCNKEASSELLSSLTHKLAVDSFIISLVILKSHFMFVESMRLEFGFSFIALGLLMKGGYRSFLEHLRILLLGLPSNQIAEDLEKMLAEIRDLDITLNIKEHRFWMLSRQHVVASLKISVQAKKQGQYKVASLTHDIHEILRCHQIHDICLEIIESPYPQ